MATLATWSPGLGMGRLVGLWPRCTGPLGRPKGISSSASSSSSSGPIPTAETKIENVRNIGIIAHVDAGKTTTTERMLFLSGVTKWVGKVDVGNTVTDFLPLERKRGITIQSAAITYEWQVLGQRADAIQVVKTVNLIDTPGHQDFRFEVDRCLPVLDGAICVLDGVKGVEAHTERVWASANEHSVPRILYVNKLDRAGAAFGRSVREIAARLNCLPLVCQLPWWAKDRFVGVIDVVNQVAYKWSSSRKECIPVNFSAVERALASDHPAMVDHLRLSREKLVEMVAELDDQVMAAFLEDPANISPDLLRAGIRRIIRNGDGSAVPVFLGASLSSIGVELLMDAVNDYLPSPAERPNLQVNTGDGLEDLNALLDSASGGPSPSAKSKLAARAKASRKSSGRGGIVESVSSVFKVFRHPTEGVLCFVRVYHGSISRTSPVWNTRLQDTERPMGLVRMSADRTYNLDELRAGQIGALRGLKKARTGDTILTVSKAPKPPSELERIQIRPPVIPPAVTSLAIDVYSKTMSDEMQDALEQLSREDPSLRWTKDEPADQFLVQGMGKLHLEIVAHTIRDRFAALAEKVSVGEVVVDYRECVTAPTGRHTVLFDKPLASRLGSVECAATIEPLDADSDWEGSAFGRGDDNATASTSDENVIETKIHSAIKTEEERQLVAGARAALARGVRRPSPVHRCKVVVELLAADTGSSPGHFSSAARQAVQAALRAAHQSGHIGILEPVMLAQIQCPESAAKAVQHDIDAGAGGQVLSVTDLSVFAAAADTAIDQSLVYAPPDPYQLESTPGSNEPIGGRPEMRMVQIVALLPLATTLDYDAHLRALTRGRQSMSTDFDSWRRVTGARDITL